MSSVGAARELIARVRGAGVSEFCVCAGSRNAPLLYVLADTPVYSFIDERSAAFFAIGRIKRDGTPVAVVTTSGTAAAELLPACVEAYYAGLPLVLITADRPARFRGTGAPQSIEQVGLFGVYASSDIDNWGCRGPLHCNIEFDEPLLESGDGTYGTNGTYGTYESHTSHRSHKSHKSHGQGNPLVILGGLAPQDRARVRDFVDRLGAPVYAEALSGLRGVIGNEITAGERMISRGHFDGVIRIGNVPTLRFWRDLEESDVPVVSYSRLPFAGLSRGELCSIDELPEPERVESDDFLERDRDFAKRLAQILDDEPASELAMLRELSRTIDGRVYLGNSLPIREWDLVAERKPFECDGNRGANGIDGQLSTFFGWCAPGANNWCVIGDLTALYDANAPWIVPQLDAKFTICIINNGGGRIFSRVASLKRMDERYRRRVIENEHAIRFDKWAEMWGISEHVIELRPDPEASARVWARYDEMWA